MSRNSAYRLVALLVLLSFIGNAQLFQARLSAFGYAWQRSDTVSQTTSHLFGYQSIQASLNQGNYTLSGYFQGFTDYSGPHQYIGEYRLYNFYFKARNVADLLDVSVGRQAVYSGIGQGTFDGVWSGARFLDGNVSVNGYYGFLPAPHYQAELIGDKKNNAMMGAQLTVTPHEMVRASLNYSSRQMLPETYTAIRADSLFNPYAVEIRPSAVREEYFGGEADVTYGSLGSLYFRYDYDLALEQSARTELFARVRPTDELALTGLYLQRQPRISFNSIFSVFAYNTVSEFEGGVEYTLDARTFLFARFGSVSYGDDNAQRVALGFNNKLVSASVAHNVGTDSRLSSVSANAGYPMMEGQLTPTLMVGYALYKLSPNADLTGAASIGIGAVYRPMQTLSIDGQLMLLSNAWYQRDVRLSLRATYLISERLGMF